MFRSSSVIRLKANPVNNLARRRKRCSKPEITCTGFSVSHIFGCRSYIAIEKSCCIRQTQVNFRSPGLGNYFRFSSNEMLAQGVAESKLGSTTSNNGESPESSSTKAKLNEILESFQTFDSDMKIGTRHRREKDEHRIAQLTTELSRLEKTLNQEIKRRIETNKSLQMTAERELEQMMEKLQSMIQTRSDAITTRLDNIVSKIDSLEENFDAEMAKIPLDIERRGEELTKMLMDFAGKFEAERLSRLEREGRILKQLSDHEQDVAADFETERTSRENTYAELRRVLDDNVRSRMKGDGKFQSFVHEELAVLKNAISLERQTRERDDGEIVDALNRYTTKLQSSLKIINSSEI